MLSRRKLFSIVLMMVVLLALYMLTQAYREITNDYDTNEYAATEVSIRRSDIRDASGGAETAERNVAFIGDGDSDMGSIVTQWCTYTGRALRCFESLTDYLGQADGAAGVLCVDPDYLPLPLDGGLLDELTSRDMVIIFGGLPDASAVGKSPELCELLGIEEIQTMTTTLSGIYLYDGFLLGGEAVYRSDGGSAIAMDERLRLPWYRLDGRTKTYIAGLLEASEDTGPDGRPPILWRNTKGNARIFAVNGDLLRDETGLGLLAGMMAESYSYTLYPVVNAQNLTVADYPSFTSENEGQLGEIYANSPRMLLQNIVWPSLVSTLEQSRFKVTCFMTPRLTYSGEYEPITDDLTYYLRQLKERYGEAGWSAGSRDMIPVAEKWTLDKAFFEDAGSGYVHTAVYAAGQQLEEFLALAQAGEAPDVRTVVGNGGEGDALLSFASEDLTRQGITHRADQYGYRDDLKNRSLQTALGYTNILLDMGCVTWPEGVEDQWENYSSVVSGNLGTWWERYSYFDKTTLTESDGRVRSFLAVEYEERLENDVIQLELSNRQGTVSFLLHTHDKTVKSVSGGTATKLEKDTWLLSLQEDQVSIQLANE